MAGTERFSEHDSLHILPLSLIPLHVQTLREKRLVKTARLETVVEMYNDAASGRGQVDPGALPELFDFSGDRQADLKIVKKLCDLHSYDVYSLRLGLRRLGIDVEHVHNLKLSHEMSIALADHMSVFTRPLILKIYGDADKQARSLHDVLRLFTDPDNATARNNLRELAKSLEINLIEIPQFLEEYADVYLSVSYFQKCSDDLREPLEGLIDDLERLARTSKFDGDSQMIATLRGTTERMCELQGVVSNILAMFQAQTEDMWRNLTAERYRQLTQQVVDHQERIAAILCAMTVKLAAWQRLQTASVGKSSQDRAHFVATNIWYGLDGIRRLSSQYA